MTDISGSTEETILKVAREVFMQHGYDGTSMQMIADAAGINKSLLHYYYRSKEKLFAQIFSHVFRQFVPHLGEVFLSEMPLEQKIRVFTERYIDVFIQHPLIPIFVMQELSKNPQHLADLIRDAGLNPEIVKSRLQETLEKEDVMLKDPRQFMVNLLGLCIFPFAARPLIQRMLFDNDEVAYDAFLQQRKNEVAEFIINAIRKQ
mgnify:CR=1 FL=1